MRTLNFKTTAGYKRWLAYGHIHKVFEKAPGNSKILIKGKIHKVQH